jgi:hypothetical protein
VTAVLLYTPSLNVQHRFVRSFLRNIYEDGYETDGSSEVQLERADGTKSITLYSGTNYFTIKFNKATSGVGRLADQLWSFFRARLDAINEPFYFYNPTECFPPDPTGVETRGRYLVQIENPSVGISREYFSDCLFGMGIELKETRLFLNEM